MNQIGVLPVREVCHNHLVLAHEPVCTATLFRPQRMVQSVGTRSRRLVTMRFWSLGRDRINSHRYAVKGHAHGSAGHFDGIDPTSRMTSSTSGSSLPAERLLDGDCGSIFRNSLFSAEFLLWQKLCQLYQHLSDSACRHLKRTLDGPHKKIRAVRSRYLSPRIHSVSSR